MNKHTYSLALPSLLLFISSYATAQDLNEDLQRSVKRCNGDEIRKLLNKGADPNIILDDEPPLMKCLSKENIVIDLIAHGADVNARGGEFKTPVVMQAARSTTTSIVRRLLAEGADANGADKSNRTALFYLGEDPKGYSMMKLLLSHGADANQTDTLQMTPLMMSARSGHVANIQLLIEHGAILGVADKQGNLALGFAARNGHVAAVQILLKAGADIDAPDGYANKSALMIAVNSGHHNTVEELIRQGANVHMEDKTGETALGIAEMGRKTRMIDILRKAGAR